MTASVNGPVRGALAALAVAALMATTACSADDGIPGADGPPAHDALVIVVGVHQGMPAADLPVEVQSTVVEAIAARAPVSVIAVDGSPTVVFRAADYEINDSNPEAHDNSVNSVVGALLDAVRTAEADSDGNDLGGGLAVAGDQLVALGARDGAIIVVDNGLSDAGYPALTTPGLLDADRSDEIVRFATEKDQMLSLPAGTAVYFAGLGYTAHPQADLTPLQREIVVSTWTAYAEAAGARVTTIPVPRSGPGPETTHSTTLVDPGSYAQFTVVQTETETTVTLQSVNFDPDSPTLSGSADRALAEILPLIQQSPGSITITGHTDLGTTSYPGGLAALSSDRAASVEKWLVEHGVDPSRITTFGRGADEPLHPQPSSDEQHAANRRVVLTFATAP